MSKALADTFDFRAENGKIADKCYVYYFVGKGRSKAEAAAKALAKFRATKVKFSEVEAFVNNNLPRESNFIEAPEKHLDVYCTIEVYCEE
jgi:hypothetical protein